MRVAALERYFGISDYKINKYLKGMNLTIKDVKNKIVCKRCGHEWVPLELTTKANDNKTLPRCNNCNRVIDARPRKMPEAIRARFSNERKGEGNPNWKGDNIAVITGRHRAISMYPCPKGKERHHIDGNTKNNAPNNILFLTRKEHMLLDGRIKNLKHFNNKESNVSGNIGAQSEATTNNKTAH